MAAGTASWQCILEQNLVEHAQLMGDRLMARIASQNQPYSSLDFSALASQIDAIEACPIDRSNQINNRIRLALIHEGMAIIAQTKVDAITHLKFTLLNPRTELTDMIGLIDRIKQLGTELDIDSTLPD
jgi:glutamate/tyrosine decarboxylase-like PLP-dependent enzyme